MGFIVVIWYMINYEPIWKKLYIFSYLVHYYTVHSTCPGKWLCGEKQNYSLNQMYFYMTS